MNAKPQHRLNAKPVLWLRAEYKPLEARAAVTPSTAKKLVDAGYRVYVEESAQRSFEIQDYISVGCTAVAEHSWRSDAPADALIIGLKELGTELGPFRHRHIHFAHIYKHQRGWRELLAQFEAGGGSLYDLEYLLDDRRQRIATFGYWAGFAGAAVAILAWARQQQGHNPPLTGLDSASDQFALVQTVTASLEGLRPTAVVIGAKGRCGQGAAECCRACGIDVVEWGRHETRRGGPFDMLLDKEILINCVFLNRAVSPFTTMEHLRQPDRQLSVICDVSCDPYGDYNPLPIYDSCTTFDNPCTRLIAESDGDRTIKALDLISIDHLPSLLPRESSEAYAVQLLPYLLKLDALDSGVWARALDTFNEKLIEANMESAR